MRSKICLMVGVAFAASVSFGAAFGQDAPQSLSQFGSTTGASVLTPTSPQGESAHIFPTVALAASLKGASQTLGALSYHGGPIMPSITIYNIFWAPPTLQNGNPAVMTAHYEATANNLATDYAGHTISSVNTQYYQTVGTTTTYISGLGSKAGRTGGFGGSYVDTAPFPISGCTDGATPGNCITNAQIQAEITKVMGIKGWTGGLTKMFLLYTAQGEGSCFDSGSSSCAYTQYCAFHSFYGAGPTIYGNEPYGNPATCQISGVPQPNGVNEDAAMTAASHEISEAITDPKLNAWWDSATGQENGDLCAYNYGAATYGTGNQNWNGHIYELQQEYNQRTSACVQVGP